MISNRNYLLWLFILKLIKGLEVMLKMNSKLIFNFLLLPTCLLFLFSGFVNANPTVKKSVSAQPLCPVGFKKSAGKEVIYCLKSSISLPQEDVKAVCEKLDQGKMGFKWVSSKKTKGYQCPLGAKLIKQGKEQACMFEEIKMPQKAQDLKPYCHYIHKGYFGFSYTPN